MLQRQKVSEDKESELVYCVSQHRDFLGSKYPVLLLVLSVVFFLFTFMASLSPGFSEVGLFLIGTAAIVGIICYAITVVVRSRNWRLGLEKILERRTSEVIPVDVKSLVALVQKQIFEGLPSDVLVFRKIPQEKEAAAKQGGVRLLEPAAKQQPARLLEPALPSPSPPATETSSPEGSKKGESEGAKP